MASPVARRLRTLALGCAWLVAAAAGACVTPAQNRQDTLVRIAHEYNDGLRWRRTEQVAPHLPADEVADFLKRLDDLGDDFEMADYEVKAITFTDAGEGADVTVDFTWYNQARALVRHTVIAQRWALRGGQWLCIKQIRTRGDRFPLVPEPMAAGAPSVAAP